MSVLNYVEHNNVSDHHDLLDKIRAYCLSEGWTIRDFQQNVQWSSGAFIAGSESYLEMDSTGYGSQALHYRFRMENSGSVTDHEWLQVGAFAAINPGKDTGNNTHPVQRDSSGNSPWNPERHNSMKPGLMEKVWIFGDDKFILVAIKLESDYCNFISFGSVELEDTSETEGNFAGYPSTSIASSAHWFNRNQRNPFSTTTNNFYYDGAAKPNNEAFCDIKFTASGGDNGDRASYSNIIVVNNAFTQRPLMKPTISIQHDSDSLERDLGTYPIFRMDVSDLQIGSIEKYGTAQYIVFPDCDLTMNKGIAVKIAN